MRTSNYYFTVEMENGNPVNDSGRVKTLREMVHAMNRAGDKRHYVKLQGRGHRLGVRSYNQSLPLKYATSADVYVYERYSY